LSITWVATFLLTAITAAGINEGFVLSQDTAALWCKFHVFLLNRSASQPDSNQLQNT
jgi:hypothetical protein